MKTKLALRIAIAYHKTRLRTIGLVSPKKAAEKAFELFCTPRRSAKKLKSPPLFHKAEPLELIFNGLKLTGYKWIPSNPNGKKIIIVHGFSSYSYKFEKYVSLFKKQGFEVVAFDAPAHGNSEGKFIHTFIYRDVLLEIEKEYGPFYGWMGHSLGGLAASLAIKSLPNQHNRKLVLIAPATETTRAIEHFFGILQIDNRIRDSFHEMLIEKAKTPIDQISVSDAIKHIQSPIYWVHDKQDTICVFDAVAPIIAAKPAHIQFHITEGLGHSRIYKEATVSNAIVQFLMADIN